jgi:hypothetical protein
VNAIHETQQTAPPSVQLAAPEKLVIKNHSSEGSFINKWLRGAQLAARIVFFIACGAIALILERLLNLLKPKDGDEVLNPSNPSDTRNAQGQPARIKVPMLPIDNYNQLDSNQVMNRLAGLSNEQLQMIRSHEARQKNRGDVLDAIDRQLAESR